MITLLDPPEDDVLYNVLYSAPTNAAATAAAAAAQQEGSSATDSAAAPTSASCPLHGLAASTGPALDAATEDALRRRGPPAPSPVEEISTDDDDDETDNDDEDDPMVLSDPFQDDGTTDGDDTVDSLRRELTAIEDSWGRHGLEHLVQLRDDESGGCCRVDGIPTFTMPVNLDMSWDESDFLEEMADDIKVFDDVAGRVMQSGESDRAHEVGGHSPSSTAANGSTECRD